MAEFLRFDAPSGGSRVTAAYAWNTTGAFFGLSVGTLILLVECGVRGSSYLAAVLSCVAGLIAWKVSRCQTANDEAIDTSRKGGERTQPRNSSTAASAARRTTVLNLLAFSSGFGVLTLEILYLRLFSLVFHNSTYTFGLVVAAFIAAFAIGAAAISLIARHIRAETTFAVASLLASVAITLSACTFVAGTGLEYFSRGDSFTSYLGGAALLVSGVVLPPVTILGVLLPALWVIPQRRQEGGWTTGRLTMFNTLGASAGAIVATFALLPLLGVWASFIAIAAIFGLIASVSFCRQGKLRMAMLTCGLAIANAGACWFLVGGWDQPDSLRHEKIVRRWESAYGWIDVVHDERTREWKIRQNLHYRLGATGPSVVRERRQALIPLLIHQRPRNVLFLGQGTGVTAGGALAHDDVENVTVVELIPEVGEATRYLRTLNGAVIDHTKARIVIDDARHFLQYSPQQYNVIISDLFVPWESQTGYLYTLEHYQTARMRLAKDGIFCQWLPLYQLGADDFEMIANSFATAFPATSLWWGQLDGNQAIIALVGSERFSPIDEALLEQQLEAINSREADYLLTSREQFYGLAVGQWKADAIARLNTDEHPRIEFQTPLSQSNRRLLTGSVLEGYYDRILARLNDLNTKNGHSRPKEFATRQSFQRFLLFGK